MSDVAKTTEQTTAPAANYNFSANSKEIVERKGGLEPGIHHIKKVDTFCGISEPNAKKETFNVIDILFEDEKGSQFKHRMFKPAPKTDSKEDMDKFAKANEFIAKELVYIATKIQNKDVAITNVASWEDLQAWVKSNIGTVDLSKRQMVLKLVPVKSDPAYGGDGKYYAKIVTFKPSLDGTKPNYGFGWFIDLEKDKMPVFSATDNANMALYLEQRQTKTNAQPSTLAAKGNDKDLPF